MLNAAWQYVLQNVLPPSFWTLLGLGLAHIRTHRKLDAQHEAMRQHVTATVATTTKE
jgi:hypothetical protein